MNNNFTMEDMENASRYFKNVKALENIDEHIKAGKEMYVIIPKNKFSDLECEQIETILNEKYDKFDFKYVDYDLEGVIFMLKEIDYDIKIPQMSYPQTNVRFRNYMR
jgi:hypothetical protein